jgi:hypothetical protein
MKTYSVALFVPLILLISIGVAVENFTTKPKKRQAVDMIKPETVYDCNYFQAHRFHDSLNNHLEEYHSISEKQGIQPVADEIAFQSFIAAEKLVKVKTSDYFYLDSFNYSFPVLTPEAKDFLDTVGARFNEMIDETEGELQNGWRNYQNLLNSIDFTDPFSVAWPYAPYTDEDGNVVDARV